MEKLYVRPCAGTILHCGSKLVMHKRSPNAGFMPNRWSTPGGHIEEYELATPRAAGVRELCEETGLEEGLLTGVALRYAKLEIEGSHLIAAFDYEAWTDAEHPLSGDGEGAPHWVESADVLDQDLTPKSRIMMEHLLTTAQEGKKYFVFDAQGKTRMRAMDLSSDIELRLLARVEDGEDVPLKPDEMHDPARAAMRSPGWRQGHGLTGVTAAIERGAFTLVFAYGDLRGIPYVEIICCGEAKRHPWPGYADA